MGENNQKIILLALLLGLSLGGTFGYSYIEGWDLLDSFYMTMITLTTTGYGEVAPLSVEGKLFTIFLMLFGVGAVAYSISFFMNELFSNKLGLNRRRRMKKKIANIKDHTIVCGFGRMGRVIAKELAEKSVDFIVIDNDPANLPEIEKAGYLHIAGDATHDDTLLEAHIEEAINVAAMISNDADNLYVVLAAKDLNPKIVAVSRASDEEAKAKIMRAGADKVVMPLAMSAMKVANTILNPAVEDYLEIQGVSLSHDERIQMADLLIDDHPSLVGKNLMNCGFKREGLIVLGVKRKSADFVFAPRSSYEFQRGDVLITLSTPEHFSEILENL